MRSLWAESALAVDLFRQDALRWVVPGRVAAPSELTFWRLIELLYHHLPLRAMAWFRFGSWCRRVRIPLMTGKVQRYIYQQYGLEISPGADIGGGLYVPHPIGTVIAARRIGRNCSIIAAVTIGMRNEWEFPTIGDDVFIGAGARVLGGIQVGDNAVVGANSVVIESVAAGATVVGAPARPVRLNGEKLC